MAQLGRKPDGRNKVKVILEIGKQKSINYSIRLKEGMTLIQGLEEIINQIKNKSNH